jgi:hypothetical protein
MPTRRQTLVGMLALGFGSAAASASAFTSSTEPQSDLRVVVESELSLVPAREDTSQYFDLDSEGEIEEFVFTKLNKRAITKFADLASIVNNGDLTYDRFELSFAAGDTTEDVAAALKIVGDVDKSGGTYTLLSGSETLDPGDIVTFGIETDFLSDGVPDAVENSGQPVSVTLEIDAIRT